MCVCVHVVCVCVHVVCVCVDVVCVSMHNDKEQKTNKLT